MSRSKQILSAAGNLGRTCQPVLFRPPKNPRYTSASPNEKNSAPATTSTFAVPFRAEAVTFIALCRSNAPKVISPDATTTQNVRCAAFIGHGRCFSIFPANLYRNLPMQCIYKMLVTTEFPKLASKIERRLPRINLLSLRPCSLHDQSQLGRLPTRIVPSSVRSFLTVKSRTGNTDFAARSKVLSRPNIAA